MNGNIFRRIGQGFCGTVWASSTGPAHKREDGGPGRSLYKDYTMHQKAMQNLSPSAARVPTCYKYVNAQDQTWWEEHISEFPENVRIPCNILITDRIPPFGQAIREAIIELYCPISLQATIKTSEPDRDCIIRPYLGRRRHLVKKSRFQAFSLRNFPLHIDQIEELGLDGTVYARIMAQTLAELYWKAHVDAGDVEFVLAPPMVGSKRGSSRAPTIQSPILGEHAIWILDFDCCKHMPLDEEGVEQAVTAFYKNDPFYPRPGGRADGVERDDGRERALWAAFRETFLSASEAILGLGTAEASLSDLWVKLVERRAR